MGKYNYKDSIETMRVIKNFQISCIDCLHQYFIFHSHFSFPSKRKIMYRNIDSFDVNSHSKFEKKYAEFKIYSTS